MLPECWSGSFNSILPTINITIHSGFMEKMNHIVFVICLLCTTLGMEKACNISKEKAGKSFQPSGEWDMWLTWDVRHCSWPADELLCIQSSLNTSFLRLYNRIVLVLMVRSHHWLSWWTQSSSVHLKYTSWIPRYTCAFLLRYFTGCSQLCYDWQITRSPPLAQTFLTDSWFLLLVSKSIIFIWG